MPRVTARLARIPGIGPAQAWRCTNAFTQQKEWDDKEKEMVACSLVNIVGRASAANILGITVRELDKLVEIYELSEKLKNITEPGASITWAREIKNLNQKPLTPTVLDTFIQRINDREITNSKDVRKLRQILRTRWRARSS